MVQFIRRISLQNRLLAVFVIPGIFAIITLFVVLWQYQDFINFFYSDLTGNDAMLQAVRQYTIAIVLLLSCILIVTFVLTILVGRSVIIPVENIRAALSSHKIQSKQTVLFDEHKDELGDLIRAINQFTIELSDRFEELENHSSQRADVLAKRGLYLQVAAELAQDTTNFKDIGKLLKNSVNLINDRFNLYFVGIYVVEANSNRVNLRAGSGEIGERLVEQGHHTQTGEFGLIGQVIMRGSTRVVNDVEADFSVSRHPMLQKTLSQIVLPLIVDGIVIGVLDIHSFARNHFDPSTVSVLQIMADLLAVAMQNANLVSNLQDRINEVNILYHRYAKDHWSRESLTDKVTGYEYMSSVVKPVQNQVPDEIMHKLRQGKPVFGKGTGAQTSSILYVPLMMFDNLIGVVGVDHGDDEQSWFKEELPMLETIASQIALALDNSRLLEETELHSRQIQLLQEVTSTAASEARFDDLLKAVSDKLCGLLNITYCDVIWFEPDGKSALIIASTCSDPLVDQINLVGTQIPLTGNGFLLQLIKTNKTQEFFQLMEHPLFTDFTFLIEPRKIHNMLVTPLYKRGEVEGAILLSNTNPTRKFTESETSLMDQVSLQLTPAIEVARSYEEATRRAEREFTLAQITRRIRASNDPVEIMKTAVNELRHILGTKNAHIILPGQPKENQNEQGFPVDEESQT